MAQSAKPHKKIPAVRTYAADLDAMRNKAVMQAPTPPKATLKQPVKKETAPKATPAIVTNEQAVPKAIVPTVVSTTPVPTALKPLPPLDSFTQPDSDAKVTLIGKDGNEAPVNKAPSGVIITDTKKDRFQFFPALGASIKNWFTKKSAERKASAAPKYVVPESSLRRGVIQKATSQTGRGTTADFSSIPERVRRRKVFKESPAPVAKKTHTSWSPNTETGYMLLPSVPVAITNVQVVPKRSFITKEKEVSEEPEIPPTPIESTEAVVTPLWDSATPSPEKVAPTPVPVSAAVVTTAPPLVEPEVVITEIPSVAVDTINEEYNVTEVPVPEVQEESSIAEILPPVVSEESIPSETESDEDIKSESGLFAISTNRLSIGFSGLVLAAIMIGLVGYFYITHTIEDELVITEPVQLIDLPLRATTVPSLDQTTLVTTFSEMRDTLTDGGQIFIQSTTATEVLPQDLIPALTLTLEPNFSQSITVLRFGFTKENQPFLVLQVDNAVAARGGMLAWEETVAEELQPYFNAGTSASTANQQFTDAMIEGNDVRLLKAVDGSTYLVYGIIGNKIIITTDIFNFSNLSQLLIK